MANPTDTNWAFFSLSSLRDPEMPVELEARLSVDEAHTHNAFMTVICHHQSFDELVVFVVCIAGDFA
eukprot:scaffold15370_cov15-Prasinocladus_malaysianus.AAC.1